MSEVDQSEVILESYEPAWVELAAAWSARIREACGDAVVEVHHIGSTSVPGLLAKPIIDLMPGLRSFEAGLEIVEVMNVLGFEARGEFGIPRRHYFDRDDVHVHAFVPGEGQWQAHLDFRDYLRAHEDARAEYAALKRQLQQRFRFEREQYADAKSDFIASILRRARSE